jgi:hypothetical protein
MVLDTIKLAPVTVGTITVAGTTLAVGGRTWSDVSDYFATGQTTYIGCHVPKAVNALEVRFQTTADADAHVVEMWGARDQDHMTLLATLTLTGGKQEANGGLYFVDTIVASTENLPKAGVVCDSAADRICRYVVDLCGYDHLVFIATTLQASASLAVQVSGY